jgi:ATP/ADP translocase
MVKVKKTSLMIFLFFIMLLTQNIVRNMKDSIIVTYISPEIIGCIKLYGEIREH